MNATQQNLFARRSIRWSVSSLAVVIAVALLTYSTQPGWAKDPNTAARFASPDGLQNKLINFEEEWDRNFDSLPDDWKRRVGKGYPTYVQAELGQYPQIDPTFGEYGLQIRLDGGGAALTSPSMEVDPEYSYVFEAWIRTKETSQRERNVAWFTVELLDSDGSVKQTIESEKVSQKADWTLVRVGPFVPSDYKAVALTVTCQAEQTRPEDLFGEAWFDNLKLVHLPKLDVTSSSEFNVFNDPTQTRVSCAITGITTNKAILTFKLYDVRNKLLDERLLEIDPAVAVQANATAAGTADKKSLDLGNGVTREFGKDDRVVWLLPIQGYGFYRVAVNLKDGGKLNISRDLNIAVVRDNQDKHDSTFGWVLPRQPNNVSLPSLADALSQAGIHWVSYPVWYGADEKEQGQRIGELAERLTLHKMDLIAVLDVPPPEVRKQFSRADLGIASSLRDAGIWQPAVEHVLQRLSFKINWWQIGEINDLSFVGYPNTTTKMTEIRNHLHRFGKNIQIGFAWNLLHQVPEAADPAWAFVVRTHPTPLTSQETTAVNADGANGGKVQIWTTLQPLDENRYDLDTRILDMISRMLANKVDQVHACLVPEPVAPHNGLLHDDLSPTELFIPFRTTAIAIAGKKFIGAIQMPNGSKNYMFSDDQETVMIVWNESIRSDILLRGEEANRVVFEELYLGDNISITDCWGVDVPYESSPDGQKIPVGELPLFITGVNREVADWRKSFAFSEQYIQSVFGKQQTSSFRFTNTLPYGTSGRIRLINPNIWPESPVFDFKASSGEEFERDFNIALRNSVDAGDHDVVVEFDVKGQTKYKFKVYRQIHVGIEGISIESTTQILPDKSLRIHITMVNETTENINFNCYLFYPGGRKRKQIIDMPPGRQHEVFDLRNVQQYKGKTLSIVAEEINGERTLNYQIPIN